MALFFLKKKIRILFFFKAFLILFSYLIPAYAESEVVRIGLANNFSEKTFQQPNPYENDTLLGAKMAVENSKEKLRQRKIKIEFVKFDYGDNPVMVSEVTRQAVLSNVLAVVGYTTSGEALLAAPVAHNGRLPILLHSATANRLYHYNFYVHPLNFGNQHVGDLMAKAAVTEFQASKAVVVAMMNCAFCQDLASSFELAFTRVGGMVVKHLNVLDGLPNYRDPLAGLKNKDFEVMFVAAPMVESARIIRDTVRHGINTRFVGGDSWGYPSYRFFSILGDTAWEGRAVFFWHENMSIPELKNYLHYFKKEYGYTSTSTIMLTYDAVMIIINALLNSTGHMTRDDLEKYLQDLNRYDGVAGTYCLNNVLYDRKTAVIVKNQGDSFVIGNIIPPKCHK
ncbi:MAG: ABC transporter substrate-binding protein [Deltaproteobacteria bacterium]|nr:ABC transporter substrate-binding protein [Deltaproteobacteria bacterium]